MEGTPENVDNAAQKLLERVESENEGADGEVPTTIKTKCVECGADFDRVIGRGRPATRCEGCRGKRGNSAARGGKVSGGGKNQNINLGKSIPPELAGFVASFPLLISAETTRRISAAKLGQPGIILQYRQEDMKQLQVAFQAWLESIDFDLTPGWALVACYFICTMNALPGAIEQGVMLSMKAKEATENASDSNKRTDSGTPTP